MDIETLEYVQKYNERIKEMFFELRKLVLSSADCAVEEKLWARLPSFYVGERFVRLIPFCDHINVEAAAIKNHAFEGCKRTPKGMLQIYVGQDIPISALKAAFSETLSK